MALYSDYGLEVHGRRHELLSELVSRLVGVEVRGRQRERDPPACADAARCALRTAAAARAHNTARPPPAACVFECFAVACNQHNTTQHNTNAPFPHTSTNKAGDENHRIALDFALQHAYHHSFGDPNPSDVAAFYDG